MALDTERINYIRNYRFAGTGITRRGSVRKIIARAAVQAGRHGMLNVNRDKFLRDVLGADYGSQYIARYTPHIISDCNKVPGVTAATVGLGASARLIIIFDDDEIKKIQTNQNKKEK